MNHPSIDKVMLDSMNPIILDKVKKTYNSLLKRKDEIDEIMSSKPFNDFIFKQIQGKGCGSIHFALRFTRPKELVGPFDFRLSRLYYYHFLRNIKESIIGDFSVYLKHFYFQVAMMSELCQYVLLNNSFLEEDALKYIKKNQLRVLDERSSHFRMSFVVNDARDTDIRTEITIVPPYLLKEIDYDKECDNFIMFLKKTVLEVNLEKI
jgi:hypothetical protein